jgi:hypothetical protein
MADWSVWKALDDWRSKRHELDPIFAKAGFAPEIESMVNRICVDLRRQTPTPPLVTGNDARDKEVFAMFHEAYARQFEECCFQSESLLQLVWVPEAQRIAEAVRGEIARIRQALKTQPGRNPGVDELEKLLRHYVNLDHPELPVPLDVISGRRQEMAEIMAYPLLVQHAASGNASNRKPILATEEFRREFSRHVQMYRETTWLHSRIVTQAYAQLALDAALARKRHDVLDEATLMQQLPKRWPSPSSLWPGWEQVDQIWYLLLGLVSLALLIIEWWWLALPVMIWLYLSIGGHKRDKAKMEAVRAQTAAYLRALKQVRDRFVSGQTSLEKLAFQLRQLDEKGEIFGEETYVLLGMHQHEG